MAFTATSSLPHLQLKQLSASSYHSEHQQHSAPPCAFLRRHKLNSFKSIAITSSRKLHRHRTVPRVNAETVPVQEEENEATVSLSPEEEDEANCRDILRVLNILKDKRDMPFNEVRLTLMIEDPIEEEQREQLGIENERGCSREDMAAALVDVYEGRIPSDRVVLRELAKEMLTWPNLEDEIDGPSSRDSPYARITNTGVDPKLAAKQKFDWDGAAEIEPGENADDPNLPPVLA